MRINELMTILPRVGKTPPRAMVNNVTIDDLPVSQVRQVLSWMIGAIDDYRDSAGEVNATRLAEYVANQFNLHDSDDVPESLFELAGAIALADQEESR